MIWAGATPTLEQGDSLRLGLAALAAAAAFGWEAAAPARLRVAPRVRRWATNLALAAASGLTGRALAGVGAVAAAGAAEAHGFGLLHAVQAPLWLAWVVTLLGLDLAVYAQHRAMHVVPWLWRVHAPHHADPEVDASTAVRFHPAEIAVSTVWKGAVAGLLGAPAAAVLAFEAVLNACALFSHANARLPERVERLARLVIVTPSLHRLHHDLAAGARAPNFGTSLIVWDHLFGSYRSAPEPKALGLADAPAGAALWPSLALPFKSPAPGSPESGRSAGPTGA